ncbi:CBS domain-containing protein [Methanothermococcus sp. SCGC AD-155-M21]|nr:CBS domain-containing protein [Methanothermococcus sp. SCGC AD-155-M21]
MKIHNILKEKEEIEVVKIYPTTTIRDALITMNNSKTRRIPVVDAGTNKVVGVVTSMDIIDFIGGGPKYNLVKSKHNHNLLAAINEPVKEIMANNPICVSENISLNELINIFLEKNIGGAPVVDKEYVLLSMITERNVISHLKEGIEESETVEKYMTQDPIVATPGERLKDVARTMLRNGFRRLPVLSEGKLVGMVTSTDFIRILGSDWAFNHMTTGNVREITNVRVSDIMKKDILVVNPNDSLRSTAEIMIKNDIGALPVVGEDNKLKGVITEKDIVSYFNKGNNKR